MCVVVVVNIKVLIANYLIIFSLEMFKTVAGTCSDLYDRGIHVAGTYTLTGGNVFCTFYGEKVCDNICIANGISCLETEGKQ